MIFVVIACFFTPFQSDPNTKVAINKATLIERHDHLERLIASASANFDQTRVATSSEKIPVIRRIVQDKHLDSNDATYKRYIYDKSLTSSVRWFRKGVKERFEFLDKTDQSSEPEVLAYDGGVVRELTRNSDGAIGFISSTEQAHWDSAPKLDPFSLLLEDFGRPWSDLLQQPSVTFEQIDGGCLVQIPDPDNKVRTIKAQFDDSGNCVQRDVYNKLSADPEPRLYERHIFSAWKEFTTPSGESVVFPMNSRLLYVCGVTDDGELGTYNETEIVVNELKINPEISDHNFSLVFPANVEVVDNLQGFGHRPKLSEVATAHVEPNRSATPWKWLIILNVVLAALLAAGFLFYRRRRQSD